ncbi:MAG: response regulator [Elusimicrobia bacterium]|nr:response regulator [Elusimicrobiota bacterium]
MKKILVADDEEVVQSFLKRVLNSPNCRVLCALNGAEALRLAEEEKPDLILLDVGMPGKNGHDVLKGLRRNIHTQTIPVILVTGRGELKDKVAGFELGADDYITKPFEIQELTVRVESLMRRSKRDLTANPLTRLPGSPAIEEEVNNRIRRGVPFAFHYIDIDHFKAFNDLYGYAKGDLVIQELATLLMDVAGAMKTPDHFVGHVGGDDFVLIAEPATVDAMAKEISTQFDLKAPAYYSPEDRARGFILTNDRLGRTHQFPLMSLSIAVVTNEKRLLNHYAKVVDIAFEIKRFLKGRSEQGKSVYLKDRRSDAPFKSELP